MRSLVPCAALAALATYTGPSLAATSPAMDCAGLEGLQFYNVTVTRAEQVPATASVPAFCRVGGHEAGTRHEIEVRLPAQWRGRYVQRGGGGFDGRLAPVEAAPVALRLGAVQTVNNGGHQDPSGAALLGDPRTTARYAHGAILTATLFGKAVTRAYYGDAPRYAYYEGCSNGGRGALNAAARYGHEFDGVVAMAPTLNMSGIIPAMVRNGALQLPSPTQLRQVHAAIVARCDALDGARDGIVANWQACDFDPVRHAPPGAGLTDDHLAALRTVWSDLHDSGGQLLYSPPGLSDLTEGAAVYARFGNGHMGFVVHGDAQWQPPATGMDIAAELPKIRAAIEDQYQFSASVEALVRYLQRGGRIIVWHGTEDPILSHRDTIRTWAQVTRAAGDAATAAGSRLYIAPGVAHCSGGPGADDAGLLPALMDWVEQARAPGELVASKRDGDGRVLFTRPLCEHPRWPRYRGSGDVDEAANHECVAD